MRAEQEFQEWSKHANYPHDTKARNKRAYITGFCRAVQLMEELYLKEKSDEKHIEIKASRN